MGQRSGELTNDVPVKGLICQHQLDVREFGDLWTRGLCQRHGLQPMPSGKFQHADGLSRLQQRLSGRYLLVGGKLYLSNLSYQHVLQGWEFRVPPLRCGHRFGCVFEPLYTMWFRYVCHAWLELHAVRRWDVLESGCIGLYPLPRRKFLVAGCLCVPVLLLLTGRAVLLSVVVCRSHCEQRIHSCLSADLFVDLPLDDKQSGSMP